MKTIADTYISRLKKAYYNAKGKEIWGHFENIKHGASPEDLLIDNKFHFITEDSIE